MAISGKVANILNERELIINKGAADGVNQDMVFKVLEPEIEVRDPETQELLGSLVREKIRVKIFEVCPKFAVGRTYETYATAAPTLLGVLTARQVNRVRTLRTGHTTAKASDEQDSFVEVGDFVIQVEEPVT